MIDDAVREATPELAQEHETLHRLLESLTGLSATDTLRSKLATLLALLERHFAREEQPDGLYELIASRAPRLQTQVGELTEQHAGLLAATRALIARLEPMAGEAATELTEQVAALAAELHQHEQDENALLQESIMTDLGDSD